MNWRYLLKVVNLTLYKQLEAESLLKNVTRVFFLLKNIFFRKHASLTIVQYEEEYSVRSSRSQVFYKSRSSPPEVFSGKDVPKICFIFTGEPPCQNVTEITLRHRCSPINLPHILRTTFSKNTCRGLLL